MGVRREALDGWKTTGADVWRFSQPGTPSGKSCLSGFHSGTNGCSGDQHCRSAMTMDRHGPGLPTLV